MHTFSRVSAYTAHDIGAGLEKPDVTAMLRPFASIER
jgi:hypothetical protein